MSLKLRAFIQQTSGLGADAEILVSGHPAQFNIDLASGNVNLVPIASGIGQERVEPPTPPETPVTGEAGAATTTDPSNEGQAAEPTPTSEPTGSLTPAELAEIDDDDPTT